MNANLEPRECPTCETGLVVPRCGDCGGPLYAIDKHGRVTGMFDHAHCDQQEIPWWPDDECPRCTDAAEAEVESRERWQGYRWGVGNA